MTLPSLFPLEKLRDLNFGSADGHRDDVINEAFIITSSIKRFHSNKHSLIVGAIGTGKSTLFRLLKERSDELDEYKNDLIVPLDEALSFTELNNFAKEYYQNKETKTLYQLLWKLNILMKIAIHISDMDKFPTNKYEKQINNFLHKSNSVDCYTDIVTKVKNLISNANIRFESKIGDNPITLEAGLSGKKGGSKKINLDEVQRAISAAISERGYDRATIIIDKIDRFVAGEYNLNIRWTYSQLI